ncbi:MAG TPA: ABC transporter ATP-binding protein [Pirellulales bacterium]|nr:ABC transporter ATP-binding protein [Pirellulales bacterium]
MAQLALDNLTKDFPGGVRALDGFSLDVADGEFVVVVGPSGSGKSTLLRLVAGLERVTAGTIRIGARAVNDLAPRRRNVAMAFQHPALYPHLSVFDNLAFPLQMRRLARGTIDTLVRAVAEELFIAPLLGRKPAAISGGEQQRVAFGRVLIREAQCNLFDEPLAHLDRPLVEQLQTCLLELHRRRPTTTLFVTHDQQEALTLGQRVVVLAAGRIQQVARPLEIYDHPANRFVAGFIGSPAMNFLDGKLVAEEGVLWFIGGAIRLRLDDDQTKRLSHRAGSPVVAGVRPEGITEAYSSTVAMNSNCITAKVSLSELQGDRVFHRIETDDGRQLVARGNDRTALCPNCVRQFQIDERQLRLFEPGTFGLNLSPISARQ